MRSIEHYHPAGLLPGVIEKIIKYRKGTIPSRKEFRRLRPGPPVGRHFTRKWYALLLPRVPAIARDIQIQPVMSPCQACDPACHRIEKGDGNLRTNNREPASVIIFCRTCHLDPGCPAICRTIDFVLLDSHSGAQWSNKPSLMGIDERDRRRTSCWDDCAFPRATAIGGAEDLSGSDAFIVNRYDPCNKRRK